MSHVELVTRYLRAFNDRDLDMCAAQLHADVEIIGDAGVVRGREAARAFTASRMQALPGVRAVLERVVAESADRIVVEYRLVNRRPDAAPWRPDGMVREIYEIRDGRIALCRTVLAVNSYVNNPNCSGVAYSQRVDVPEVRSWIAAFMRR